MQRVEARDIAVAMVRMQAPQVNEPIDRLQSAEGRQVGSKVQETRLRAPQLQVAFLPRATAGGSGSILIAVAFAP